MTSVRTEIVEPDPDALAAVDRLLSEVPASDGPSAGSVNAARAAVRRRRARMPPSHPRECVIEREEVEDATRSVPMRVYRCPTSSSTAEPIVYARGGGWVLGEVADFDSTCVRLASDTGRAVYSVDYRLAPEHPFPAARDDVLVVTGHVAGHTAESGDVAPLLVGESAGAQLVLTAAMLAVRKGTMTPKGLVLWYPVVDLPRGTADERAGETAMLRVADIEWFVGHYLGAAATSNSPHFAEALPASPSADVAHATLAGLPPTLVVLAGNDPSAPGAHRLVENLAAAGVSVTELWCRGLPHAFLSLGLPEASRAPWERMLAWMSQMPRPAGT